MQMWAEEKHGTLRIRNVICRVSLHPQSLCGMDTAGQGHTVHSAVTEADEREKVTCAFHGSHSRCHTQLRITPSDYTLRGKSLREPVSGLARGRRLVHDGLGPPWWGEAMHACMAV